MSDVVFVYLGQNLPRYVDSSLKLAVRYSAQRVVLLANALHERRVRQTGAEFIPIEVFYDSIPFKAAREKLTASHTFRRKFWLYTLERLFVLEQYMAWSNSASLFHAELDQLLFKTDDLVQCLNATTKKGLFFPFHSAEKAVASVLFINNRSALEKLLTLATAGKPYLNEMELLVRFAKIFPEDCIELPTIGTALPTMGNKDFVFAQDFMEPADLGLGVVDAAELGLWVGGRDPRNLGWRERPSTKWVYEDNRAALRREYLDELRFHFKPGSKTLHVSHRQAPEITVRLYNLHMHSKIHAWVYKHDLFLNCLFGSANSPDLLHIPASRKMHLQQLMIRGLQNPSKPLRTLLAGLRR